MDPFGAISLAGNIIAFVEFGIKVTTRSSEIFASISSETLANRVMKTTTDDLLAFNDNMRRSLSPYASSAEEDIASLARECSAEAVKLMTILNKLQGAGKQKKGGKLPPLMPALKSLWKQKDIEEIQQRLTNFRAQITLRLVALVNDKHSTMTTLLVELMNSNSKANAESSAQLQDLQVTINEVKNTVQRAARQPPQGTANMTPVSVKLEILAKLGDHAVEKVLKSLRFESMHTRESTVAKAHSETFGWLYTDDSSFSQWLSSSDGVYWVSGKPGSGKSTLMKLLSGHPKTGEALRTWGKDEPLITASFYFWNAGTVMQKSLQGLLQSLLYEILKQCPWLIPVVTPNRWGNAFNLAIEDPWSWQEATEAFGRFTRQTKLTCKTALFIDGLDEYDGDHSEMVRFLSKMSQSPNLKLCLASRPYNVFESAYGHDPDRMLRLQDLTRDDIRQYAYDNFKIHQNLIQLNSLDVDQYNHLIEEIVDKADGVFLWVYLVVRSLKEGFTNADPVSTMQKRLRQLPSDLQQYFTHILRSVDEVYWESTTKVFQMTTLAVHLLPVGVLTILDEEEADFCLDANIRHMSRMEYEKGVGVLNKRLNARCKGLLEIRATPGHLYGSRDYNGRHLVDFLHRTVRDFLRVGEVDALLKSRLKSPFDADVALCQGFLVQLKQFIVANDPKVCRVLTVVKSLEDLGYHAKRITTLGGEAPVKVLDEALRAIKGTDIIAVPYTLFHFMIIRHGLSRYLEYRLGSNSGKLIMDEPLLPLEIALTRVKCSVDDESDSRYDFRLHPSVVQVLVDHGTDPNESAGSSRPTVWKTFIRSMLLMQPQDRKNISAEASFQTCEILLKAGAEVYEGLSHDINRLFEPNKARLLMELIRQPTNANQGNHYSVTYQFHVTADGGQSNAIPSNNHIGNSHSISESPGVKTTTQARISGSKPQPGSSRNDVESTNDHKKRKFSLRSLLRRLK